MRNHSQYFVFGSVPRFIPYDSKNIGHLIAAKEIWNEACGAQLALSVPTIRYNSTPSTGVFQAGRFAQIGERLVGFVIASVFRGDSKILPYDLGWIDAIAVLRNCQRSGLGTSLLDWADEWLNEEGIRRARLGGSLRPFAPGLPAELGSEVFFTKRGYHPRAGTAEEWDVAKEIAGDELIIARSAIPPGLDIRVARSDDVRPLQDLLSREFPGRWEYEFEEFTREGGRISDYVIAASSDGINAFARLTFEDSERPIERFFMTGLPRPWGQLGPIGVSKRVRRSGYGRAVIEHSLSVMREREVRTCVIDWTSLTDLYAKFGFKPYRKYRVLVKTLR